MGGQGAYIFGCAAERLSAAERAFFARAQPWGFILFARNVQDPAQLAALTDELRDSVGRDAPIFTDQEGGRVARLTPPHWREWLAPLDQVAQNRRGSVRAMYLRYRIIADELRAVGIDGDFAPCADIATADTHPFLKNRCYGEDVVHVAERAGAVAQALLDGGVLPVVKHMPGHGRARADSHEELPHVRARHKTLRWTDFMAFEPLAELPLGMTAHVVYDCIDEHAPGTLSPEVIGLIRDEIGFHGLLMTDDISMGALDMPDEVTAARAIAAGCEVILQGNGTPDQMRAVADAVGPLSARAQARADAALTWRRAPRPIDIGAAEAEFRALMTGQANG